MIPEETIELANSLSLNQVRDLITIFSDRIHVHVGDASVIQDHIDSHSDLGNFQIGSELMEFLPVVTNGATLQINLEISEPSDES